MSEALKLADAIKQLSAAVTTASLYLSSIDRNDIPTLVKSFKKLKDDVDVLEEVTKVATGLVKELSYNVIPEAFENHNFDSVKIGGYNYILSVRMNASIPQDKQEAGFEWLQTHGLGSIIKPAVNPRTLTSAIKEYIAEKGEVPPESVIPIFNQRYISVRKT
jgi:hypothetical protein